MLTARHGGRGRNGWSSAGGCGIVFLLSKRGGIASLSRVWVKGSRAENEVLGLCDRVDEHVVLSVRGRRLCCSHDWDWGWLTQNDVLPLLLLLLLPSGVL